MFHHHPQNARVTGFLLLSRGSVLTTQAPLENQSSASLQRLSPAPLSSAALQSEQPPRADKETTMASSPTTSINSTNWCGVFSFLINAHNETLDPNLSQAFYPNLSDNCTDPSQFPAEPDIVTWAQAFYTWSVPVVLFVGVVGNALSLRVFLSANMRKLSASTYLAALSTSDILALVFYVLMEWLRWGLPQLNHSHQQPAFLNVPGVCHALVYLSYVTRFLSAWLIVVFTVERYIGVCHPLKRKDICGRHSAPKVLATLLVVAMMLMLFKPILTSSRHFQTVSSQIERCLPDPDRRLLSFVLDTVYGLSITLLPFLLISLLNALIIRKLLRRNRRHKKCHVVTEESIIRMEFTVILLVVSFVFIVLNLPYCIVWCQRFLLAKQDMHQLLRANDYTGDRFDHYEGALIITRVVFYVNYCVNFFLYSVTGAYFRKELKMLVFYRAARAGGGGDYFGCSRQVNSSPTTPQSWL